MLDGKLSNIIWRGWSIPVGEIKLKLPETVERITEIQKELIARNKVESGLTVIFQVTRGADKGRDFAFPKGDVKSSLVMFTSEKDIINAVSKTDINVITVPDIRWKRVIQKRSAAGAGAGEAGCCGSWSSEHLDAIENGYIHRRRFVVEHPSSTEAMFIITTRNSNGILPGLLARQWSRSPKSGSSALEERS